MSVWTQVRALGLLGLAVAGIGGCNDNDLGIEKRRANQPPATLLTSGPPDSTTRTEYRVHLYWTGSDVDGRIDHYDYILVDHPASDDDIDPADPAAPNRVVVEVPRIDDRRWRSTTTTDTLIVTRADTLRLDPSPLPGSDPDDIERRNEFVRRQSFERWHTFFVRAVDNEGLPDPDPDYRSFNSRTLAPMVNLLPPVQSEREFHGPPTIVFNWDGTDDDGDGVVRTPIASRWVCLPTRKRQDLTYSNFPDTLYQLPQSAWSPWRAWDARDGSGRQAVVRDLRPASATEDGLGYYFFAVQAMDEAGAVTPVFDWTGRNDRNNATPILVTGDVGPRLEMEDPFLGEFDFIHGDQPQQADIAVGQTVRFCWRGDASSYGGRIVAYRYGWDMRNPSNDQEWEQNWSEQARCLPPRAFSSGSHVLMVEARDNAESVTRGRIELTVRQVTRNRDLLLVDDTRQPQGPVDELAERRRWIEVIDSLRTIRPFAFDPNRDIYEVAQRNNKEPPIELLFDYKTVIWNVVGNSNGSALRRVARLIDPNEPGRGTGNTFNYLNLFLANGGEIWVTGYFPTLELAPIAENRPSRMIVPDNITNWNPKVRGDQPDSVGAGSFLYRMGIEAVDIANGSIVPDPRSDAIDQGCIGFRRAGGPGGGTQTYVSTRVQNHEHELEIPGSDVDLPPADGVTYLTSTQDDHAHTVFLSASQLVDLRRGVRVIVDTDSRPVPVPHLHTFELEDEVGRWGAPAFLRPDDGTWPLPPRSAGNPRGGRSGIEIFNMPDFLVNQTPRLDPPPGRVLTLYEFVSLTPADHDHSVLYPTGTADEQPALILSKGFETDPQWTRAYCGFEPWRLQRTSHLRLAEFILLQHMRVGLPDIIP